MATRVVLYGRVSLDRNATGRSVSEQLDDLRKIAEREGWQIVREFTDNDRSASRYARKSRPGFADLVKFIEAGNCDLVAVWESSRLTRDPEQHFKMQRLCRERGVRWAVQARIIDHDDLNDTFGADINAVVDGHASDQTSARVRRAVIATANNGRPHGKNQFGYTRVYDSVTRHLLRVEINEDQAAVLRGVADRFLAGEAFYAIARDLTARGVPTPRAAQAWYATNLARLLRNPAYAGQRLHKGQYVADAIWPAIFTDSQWRRLQAKLRDPARSTRKDSAARHLLSHLAVCGKCGGTVQSRKQRGGYRVYSCVKGFCAARKESDVDELVERTVVARLAMPDIAGRFASVDDADAQAALEDVKELRARLDGFVDAATAGEISAPSFARIEAALLRDIEEADAKAVRVSVPPVLRDLVTSDDVAALWGTLSVVSKRDAIRALLTVELLPTRRGDRSFDPDSVRITWRTRRP